MYKDIRFVSSEKDLEKLKLEELLVPGPVMDLYTEDSLVSFRKCSGIDNLFKKARKLAVKQGCDVVYNPSHTNTWIKGFGAEGRFEFYLSERRPGSPYR